MSKVRCAAAQVEGFEAGDRVEWAGIFSRSRRPHRATVVSHLGSVYSPLPVMGSVWIRLDSGAELPVRVPSYELQKLGVIEVLAEADTGVEWDWDRDKA